MSNTANIVNNGPPQYVDVSAASPDDQFAALVNMLEYDDAKTPAPNTGTPPGPEWIPVDEYIDDTLLIGEYEPPPDLEAVANSDLLSDVSMSHADEPFPAPDWENDDQYHTLAVPPGVPNYGQPIETGHSQINLPNPGSEVGTFAWSGAITLARVARHENNFPSYGKGTSRGHGVTPEKFSVPYFIRTQQGRDMLLTELKQRGAHNIVVQDMPAQTYNEQVLQVDPTAMENIGPQQLGEEGYLD